MENNDNLELILVVGCPASGKSTFANHLLLSNPSKYDLLSSDALRARFGKDESDQNVTGIVFNHINQQTDFLLSKGQSVIIDATNINKKDRKNYLIIANKYNAKKIAYVFDVDRETLIKRNATRVKNGGRDVPTWVIDRMLSKYEPPTTNEGFDEIVFK